MSDTIKTFSVSLKLLENYLFEIDFGEFGNMMTDLKVSLKLGKSSSALPSLQKALTQFENFCTVTQSVRHGVNVSAEVFDASGECVHGTN